MNRLDAPREARKQREPELPEARRRRRRLSTVWLVPIAALGLVAYLAYSWFSTRGPEITITFETADGLAAQQTEVRYKAVALGLVESIRLSDDASHVVATVRMNEEAEDLLTDHARFWVVRPRLNGGPQALEVGLETLVSGAYVAMDPGAKRGKSSSHFKGLEKPPSVRSDEPGTVYFVDSADAGSLFNRRSRVLS